MAAKTHYKITEISRQQGDEIEEANAPGQPSRLRTILSRAALLYLGLFLGVSLFLSMLGLDPLIHHGALPKYLLAIVGLAMILALANDEANLADEQARSRLALFSHWPFRRR